MWKKDDAPEKTTGPQPDTAPRPEWVAPSRSAPDRATIGRSIAIRGDVTGDEDLVIQGRVEGSVDLQQHTVTVGPDGEVKATIVGRVVTVEGRVDGNIKAEEQVILRSTATVQGDITAPRVVLEDGARFRGGVDMGDSADTDRGDRGVALPQPRKGSEGDRTVRGSDRSAPASGGERIEKGESASDSAAAASI